ncbi:MAG: hypothetical protein LBM68_00580 [Bacteroidales bacterium]|jgi:hypothetical protein|nr:hypothetical protein [Bacteroidales bacterium]
MKNRVIYSVIAVCVFCTQSLVAQQQEDEPELGKTIKVYSEYKPQINDAQRLLVNPTAYDTVKVPVELKYTFEAAPVDVVSELRTLRAVSVKGDKLQDLFRGYAAVGGGNYNSFMADVRFMTERSRQYQNGIEFLHNSSAGKVRFENDEKYPANYMYNTLSVYTKRFLPTVTLSAGIKPSFNRYLQYGRDVNSPEFPEISYNKKDIRRTIFSNQSYVGVQSNTANLDYLNYTGNLGHNITVMNPQQIENSINLQAEVKQNVGTLRLGAEFATEWHGVNFVPLDSAAIKKNTTQISLKPYLVKTVDDITFEVGLLAQQTIDGNSAFKLHPHVRLSANVLKQTVVPYISYSGNYKQYSMLEMLNENPYTKDFVLLQPANTIADVRVGAQGRMATVVPFNAYVQYKAFNNEHFWVNDFSNAGNTFLPLYDNGTMFRVHGEIGVRQPLFAALAQLSYNRYSLNTLEHAWHKPAVEAQIDLKYNIQNPLTAQNKLVITTQFFAYGSQYALAEKFSEGIAEPRYEAVRMSAIVDFNIHLDYYYNTALVIFCRVNNITATRYQRFYLYPSQRTNFLAGLSYSFGNKK